MKLSNFNPSGSYAPAAYGAGCAASPPSTRQRSPACRGLDGMDAPGMQLSGNDLSPMLQRHGRLLDQLPAPPAH